MKNADGCLFSFMEKQKNCVTVHGYEQLQICTKMFWKIVSRKNCKYYILYLEESYEKNGGEFLEIRQNGWNFP